LIHEDLYEKFVEKIVKVYQNIKIGNPLEPGFFIGPLHSKAAVKEYLDGIEDIKKQGGKVLVGGEKIPGDGNYVLPTLISIDQEADIINHELFVPITYLLKFKTIEEAIELNNRVPQGLASTIFTKNIGNYHKWIGPSGSDCGMVHCNTGTEAVEIGAPFGGEKETGGGRECGSDSWKQYMRRSTCTVNYSNELPLA